MPGAEIIVYPGTQQAENVGVAVLDDDTFVVCYENRTASTSVLERFDADGVQQGSDYTLPEADEVVRIAALPTSGFVLVFQNGSQGDTVTRVFDDSLVPQSTLATDANLSLTFGSENKLRIVGNLAYLAFALVFISEILSRYLFHASMVRIGI